MHTKSAVYYWVWLNGLGGREVHEETLTVILPPLRVILQWLPRSLRRQFWLVAATAWHRRGTANSWTENDWLPSARLVAHTQDHLTTGSVYSGAGFKALSLPWYYNNTGTLLSVAMRYTVQQQQCAFRFLCSRNFLLRHTAAVSYRTAVCCWHCRGVDMR